MLASIQVIMTKFFLVSLLFAVEYQDGAWTGTMPPPFKSVPTHVCDNIFYLI